MFIQVVFQNVWGEAFYVWENRRLFTTVARSILSVMEDLPSFAARLREARADAKMTQHELAERSGVHRQTIARLELGTREPTWQTVQLLAGALGVDCRVFGDPSLQPPAAEPSKPRGRPRKDAGQDEPAPAKKTRKGRGKRK